MAKTKRILMNFTMVCVILLFSVLCSFFVCLNSDNENLKLNAKPEETIEKDASIESSSDAEIKYETAVKNLAYYKLGVPQKATHYFHFRGMYYTCAVIDPSKSGAEGYYTLEDSYYTISDAQEYLDFANITNKTTVKSTWEIVNGGQIKGNELKQVRGLYMKYPFELSSAEFNLDTFKVGFASYAILNTSASKPDNLNNVPRLDPPSSIHLSLGDFLPEYSKTIKINTVTEEDAQLKVMLENDIEITFSKDNKVNEAIHYFGGIFEGNGHTIRFKGENDVYNFDSDTGIEGYGEGYSSFCKHLGEGAVIRNLKIDYSGMTGYLLINNAFATNRDSVAGGIVGCNKGLVENCIVDSPRVYSERYNSNAYYGALVGRNDGTVKNCIVQGDFKVKAHNWNLFGNPTGINAYWGCVMRDAKGNQISTSVVNHCLFNANVSEEKMSKPKDDLIRSPADVGKTAGKNQLEYDPTVGVSSCYDVFNGGNRKVDLAYKDLSPKAVGGSIEEAGTPWYFAPDYRDVPLLRPFMNWRSISFKVANAAQGGVDPESIKVPSDANDEAVGKTRGSYDTIKILNQSITAKPANQTLTVLRWEWDGSSTYTVYFSENFAYFEFINEIDYTTRVNKGSGSLDFNKIYRVTYGTEIEVKINPYLERPSSQTVIQSFEYIIHGAVYTQGIGGTWFPVNNKLIVNAKPTYYMTPRSENKYKCPDNLNVNQFGKDSVGNVGHQQIYVGFYTAFKQYNITIM